MSEDSRSRLDRGGRFCGLVVLGVVMATGCQVEAPPTSRQVEVRDSAGITIVQNGPLDLSQDLVAAPEPVLEIGVKEGEDAYQFFQVSDVTRLPDGSIAVADGGSREVRFFGPDGTLRVTVGGQGRGPSEFRYPSAVHVLAPDTVMVQDFMDRVIFTSDGVFLGRMSTDMGRLRGLWGDGSSEGGAWVPGGSLFAPVYHWDQDPPVAGPPFRPEMTLVRVGGDLTASDTLGEFGGIRQQYVEVGGSWGVTGVVPPFSANTSWAVGSADGTILVGDNASPEFRLFRGDGRQVIARWQAEAAPLGSDEIEAWKDRQRSASWTQQRLPELERGWAKLDYPDSKTFYGRVASGADGSVWLGDGDYGALEPTFLVFDAQGQYRGAVRVPGPFVVHDAGPGWVLGVARDAEDVEYVRLYQLVG